MPSPRGIALRDQLAALIRDAELPISTPELASLTLRWPVFPMLGTCDEVHDHVENNSDRMRLVDCEVTSHRVAMWPQPSLVYPHLRYLETSGVITRFDLGDMDIDTRVTLVMQESRRGNHRPVYWRYTAQTDAGFNAIIAAMEDTDA